VNSQRVKGIDIRAMSIDDGAMSIRIEAMATDIEAMSIAPSGCTSPQLDVN
jgi:hypothetical protein